MDHKFILRIAPHNYFSDFGVNKTFTNNYGNWHVHVGIDKNYFKFILVLSPIREVSAEALKGLKIKVDFINQENCSIFSHNNKTVYQCGSLPIYECYFTSRGLSNGFFIYFIDIKIDASSISDLLKINDIIQPTNISVNAVNSYLKTIFESNKLADITIKTADEKEIKASKFILSRSPVFDAMLNRHDTREAQEGVIEITDIKHEVLVEMIRYMYTDEIPKLKEMVVELLGAANKYNLPGLVDECKLHLMRNISIVTFASILIAADELAITDLKNAAIKYIIENHNAAFATNAWKSLKQNNGPLGMEVLERFVQTLH